MALDMERIFDEYFSDLNYVIFKSVVDDVVFFRLRNSNMQETQFKIENGRFFMFGNKDGEWHEYTSNNEEDFRLNLTFLRKIFTH